MNRVRSYDCPVCGKPVVVQEAVPPPVLVVLACSKCGSTIALENPRKEPLIPLGYVFAALSLVVCPPGFMIAGIVCGVVNLDRGRGGHGTAQVFLSVILGGLGMFWGFLVGSGALR